MVKKTPAKKTPPPSPVMQFVVNPSTWEAAKEAANYDLTRLQIVDVNTVVVWNSDYQRRQMTTLKMNLNAMYGKGRLQ